MTYTFKRIVVYSHHPLMTIADLSLPLFIGSISFQENIHSTCMYVYAREGGHMGVHGPSDVRQ